MRSLYWFRHDLRVKDNVAFSAAVKASQDLAAVYFIPVKTWLRHDYAACKVALILRELSAFQHILQQWGITLWVYVVDTFEEEVEKIQQLCQQHHFNAVYANREYEWDERCRDEKIEKILENLNIAWQLFDDNLLFSPGEILNQSGNPFQVFTPFKRVFLQKLNDAKLKSPPLAKKTFQLFANDTVVPEALKEFNNTLDLSPWPQGTKGALQRLSQFCHDKVTHYAEERDYPALSSTSQLSAYLALGIISSRQCFQAAYQQQALVGQSVGIETWVSELIWREFYKHIVWFSPHVCRHQAFKKEKSTLPWNDNIEWFNRWCQGQTGFPLVDAAMRQLKQTGWMHNRLRMVVAMFLSKTLFIDWRWGEKYFMRHLIDGDFAANNGGWQWSASTGTDAVPYFRIFNPIRQSERFDANGDFIRLYCPELKALDAKTIHMPYRRGISLGALDYPQAMIDEAESHPKTIAIFKLWMEKSNGSI